MTAPFNPFAPGGGHPAPPPPHGGGGGGRAGLSTNTSFTIAGVVALVIGIILLITLGMSVGWAWGAIVGLIAAAAAFGTTFLLCLHPPQPRPASPAPAPVPPAGGTPAVAAPAATTNHTFIAIEVGAVTTVVTSIFLTVGVARFSDDGAFRTLAFLAPYVVAGCIASRALFKRGS